MTSISIRGLLLMSLTICAVGVLDAFIGSEWDLFAILLLTTMVQVAIWFRQWSGRAPVALRSDLAHELELQAERNGEQVDVVLDRAVAWYHHGLYGGDTPV